MSENNYLSSLENALNAFSQGDNKIRVPAENFVNNEIENNMDTFFFNSAKLLTLSNKENVKNLVCVFIRKKLATNSEPPKFCKLQDKTQLFIKNELLKSAINENNSLKIKNQIIDCITELGVRLSGFSEWQELIPWTMKLFDSKTSTDKINALQICGLLCENTFPNIKKQFQNILNIYQKSLQDNALKVQIAGIEAISLTMKSLESKECFMFKPLIGQMLKLLEKTVGNDVNKYKNILKNNNNKEEEIDKDESFELTIAFLEILCDIARCEPTLFQESLDTYVRSMIQLSMNNKFPDNVRTFALEFLVTLGQGDPSFCRKSKTFPQAIVDISIGSFLLELCDDETWETELYGHDEFNELPSTAEYALDRITDSLDASIMLPLILKKIGNGNNSYWKSIEWRKRHAALTIVTQISEYIEDEKLVLSLASQALMYFQDANKRIKFAALNCIGQMASDHDELLIENLNNKIFESLIKLLSIKEHSKVQAHTAACIHNLTRSACVNDNEICINYFKKYLDKILENLFVLLKSTKQKYVQEEILSCIGGLAIISKKQFIKYYETFAPILLEIIAKAVDSDMLELRGRALECIGHIGASVGHNKFGNHANQLMPFTISYFNDAQLNGDEPFFGVCLQLWPNIAKAIGVNFNRYMDKVAPILIRAAKLDCEVLNYNEESKENDEQQKVEEVWYEKKKAYINVSKLENKTCAIEVITDLTEELKHYSLPYLRSFFDILINLCEYQYSYKIRQTSILGLPVILRAGIDCLKSNNNCKESDIKNMVLQSIKTLYKILSKDRSSHVMTQTCHSLLEILRIFGSINKLIIKWNLIDEIFLNNLLNLLFNCIKKSQRRIELMNNNTLNNNKTFDEIDQQALFEEQEEEDRLLLDLAFIIAELIKIYQDNFIPLLSKNMGIIHELLKYKSPLQKKNVKSKNRNMAAYIHKTTVYVLCDIYEQCTPKNTAVYIKDTLPLLVLLLGEDKDARCLQAIYYLLGLMVEKCYKEITNNNLFYNANIMKSIMQYSIQDLKKSSKEYINNWENMDTDNLNKLDNLMSMLYKILKYINFDALKQLNNLTNENINEMKKTLLLLWFNHLPIKADSVEAIPNHKYLFELIKQKNPLIVGKNLTNLTKILHIYSQVINTDYSNKELDLLVKEFAKTVNNQNPNLIKNLSNKDREVLGLL